MHPYSEKKCETIYTFILKNLHIESRYQNTFEAEQTQVINAYSQCLASLFNVSMYTVSKLFLGTCESYYSKAEFTNLCQFMKALRLITVKLYPLEDFSLAINFLVDLHELVAQSKNMDLITSCSNLIADIFKSLTEKITSEYNTPAMRTLCEGLLTEVNDFINKKKQVYVIVVYKIVIFKNVIISQALN